MKKKPIHSQKSGRGNQKALTYALVVIALLLFVIAIEFAVSLAGSNGYGSIFTGMMAGGGGSGMIGGAGNFSARIGISVAESYANTLPPNVAGIVQ